MNNLDLRSINIGTMASGHLYLNLSENIKWENFPKYAEDLTSKINGKILNKTDGPDMRIWKILLQFSTLNLVYEDFPSMVSIESNDNQGDKVIKSIYEKLLSL